MHRRRTFLFHGTAAAAALLAGCSSAHSPEPDGALPDAGATHDGGPLFTDASSFRDAALGGALVITAPFRVLLNDTTCSHNGTPASSSRARGTRTWRSASSVAHTRCASG